MIANYFCGSTLILALLILANILSFLLGYALHKFLEENKKSGGEDEN